MVGRFRRLARRLGYDVLPFPGAAPHWARIAELLAHHEITVVLDVGANTGQYATAIRNNGYRGRIVSYEPTAAAHAALLQAAAGDPTWNAAKRCAVGDIAQDAVQINASAESDMSSLLPMTNEARGHMPTAAAAETETVPMVTLADEWTGQVMQADRVFLKVDTQGYEDKVLDGLGSYVDSLVGLQLELGLQTIYEGQGGYLGIMNQMAQAGFEAVFVVPGYYSRHFRRMIDFDMLWFRP